MPQPDRQSGEDPAAAAERARDLHDAREQSVASHDILVALGRAGDKPEEVLDVIVERAVRLCSAEVGLVSLVDGDVFRLSRTSGPISEEFRRHLHDHPVARTRASLIGRVAEDRRTEQIVDVLSDAGYGRQDLQRLAGYRTILSAPMIFDDEVVGVLQVWRTAVEPFDEREVEMLSAFAVQATIVVSQVELMRTLEARGVELASKIAQLEALREVGDAVSSSLDLDEVLERIVSNAVRLTGTDGGSIMEYDESQRCFSVRAAYGSSADLLDRLRRVTIRLDASVVGRAGLDRKPVEVVDLGAVDRDPHLAALYDDGWRSMLAVPMFRHQQLVGALVIRRRTTGTFPEEVRDMLQGFAAQSSIAIVNARMFGELDVKRAELEVASRHKSEFLASMSHELRTPLNAVIGFSEVLLDRMFGDINERQEEYLNDIRRSGRHLLELLNEILDLSKIESGRMVLEPDVFSVPLALEHVVSLLRERAVQHDIELDLVVEDGVSVVEADELRFKQVVLNLVSNAVKFTPDGGRVQVEAHRAEGDLVVTVTDTGPGVPPEDRERIFESFQQGARGASKHEGTGLGLTLCRRIIELFGGRLWMESEVGRGSTFGFAVPLRAIGTAPDPGVRPARDPGTVLLVDDDQSSLDLMSAYLSGTGLRVRFARDGMEALDLLRRAHPGAIVLDIRLPQVDGWQVLDALRADPGTADIPVVVVSIVDERKRGLALGAADYLLKPVNRDDLLGALRRTGALPDTEASAPGADGAA